MISAVVQAHKEPHLLHFLKSLRESSLIDEVILVTRSIITSEEQDLVDVHIMGITSCGGARNAGGALASNQFIFFSDAHVCFDDDSLKRLCDASLKYNAVAAPAIGACDYPNCEERGGYAYGVRFSFKRKPFEWVWLSKMDDKPFYVPFVCGCAFVMQKKHFNLLRKLGGFLHDHEGLGWEEEFTMRLYRYGVRAVVDPEAKMLHLFKRSWPAESTRGYIRSRLQGLYINVHHLFNEIVRRLKEWGWEIDFTPAFKYTWLRRMLPRLSEKEERWFLEV